MVTGITTAAETNPDAIIVITDGWTPWAQTHPPARTVIAALTNNHGIPNIPAWIQPSTSPSDERGHTPPFEAGNAPLCEVRPTKRPAGWARLIAPAARFSVWTAAPIP